MIKFNDRYDVDFLYTTTTLGVDPGYSSQSFYSGIMGKDTARVNGRFADAAQNGVRVERRVVGRIYVIYHVTNRISQFGIKHGNIGYCD